MGWSNSMRCNRLVRFDKIEEIKIDNSKPKKKREY